MSRYRVEKHAVDAVLLLTDGSSLPGRLYLAPFSPNHQGPQTVPDLMAEAGPAFPFRHADGRFLLVGKPSVAAVRREQSEPPDAELVARIPARVRITGGHTLEGNLLAERGAGERASDVINTPDPWVVLEASQGLHWIAKHHFLTLEPLES